MKKHTCYAEIRRQLGAGFAAALMLLACTCSSCARGTPSVDSEPAGTGTDMTSAPGEAGGANETTGSAGSETDPPETTEAPAAEEHSVLDGKKVIFIGNSMIYYGGVVTKGGYRGVDTGLFYRICRANGDKTTVIDCTYGNHHLYDFTGKCRTEGCDVGVGGDLLQGLDLSTFDYVFMSESGNNNSNFLTDVRNVMARFPNPDTVFVYMCHTYSYDKGHTKVTGQLEALRRLGVVIADWGHICYDLYSGNVRNPKATVRYVKNTFVNSVSGDSHHPNPLAGYIAALTCYCAVTGRSAVGQRWGDITSVMYGSGSVSYAGYTNKYYTSGNSNFTDVFDSPEDMTGIQGLIDEYVAKWKK